MKIVLGTKKWYKISKNTSRAWNSEGYWEIKHITLHKAICLMHSQKTINKNLFRVTKQIYIQYPGKLKHNKPKNGSKWKNNDIAFYVVDKSCLISSADSLENSLNRNSLKEASDYIMNN